MTIDELVQLVAIYKANGQTDAQVSAQLVQLFPHQSEADNQFIFGDPGDRIFAGEWTGDGIDTPGLYRKPTGFIYLKYTNSTGPADKSSTWMVGGHQWPIAGVFSR